MRRIGAMVALGALAACAFGAAWLLRAKGLSWAANVTGMLSFALTAATLATPIAPRLLAWLRGVPPVSRVTVAKAREELATALSAQWAEEERTRRINDPRPLQIRWESRDGALTGQFDGIHAAFTHISERRLIVLGEAGTGKSALALRLTRDLLAARKPGEPIPVLLRASTWTEDLGVSEWIANQLVKDHPGLSVRVRTETGGPMPLAPALVDAGVLPIIDGLDELPPERWHKVIAEVNAYGSDSPLVLTSRPEEYGEATAERPVAMASVVRLLPLGVAEVKSYLEEATSAPADRWRDVFRTLDAAPDGPLAAALATPLMLWLARTVYENGDSRPGELTELPDRAAIEERLIGDFVPAVYAPRPGRRRSAGFRCTPEQARRWLGFLAYRASRPDEEGIAWWRLCLAERGWSALTAAVAAVLNTCALWWIVVWALTRRGYWRDGGYVGHGHYLDLLLDGPLGRIIRPLVSHLVVSSGGTAGLDQQFDRLLRDWAHAGLILTALGVAVGAFLSTLISASVATVPPVPAAPRMRVRRIVDRVATSLYWAAVFLLLWRALAGHPLSFPVALLAALVSLRVARRLLKSFGEPVDISSAAGPAKLLRQDRRVYVVRAGTHFAYAGLIWLWCGGVLAVASISSDLVLVALQVLVGYSPGCAWNTYTGGRFQLALRGRLPWRTMSFLEDAHRRGVLRQAGAVYHFRHIRLQEHLARGYLPWPPWLAYPISWVVSRWIEARTRVISWEDRLDDSNPVRLLRVSTPDESSYEVTQEIRPPTAADTAVSPIPLGVLLVAWFYAFLIGSVYWMVGVVLGGAPAIAYAALWRRRYRRGIAEGHLAPGQNTLRVTPSEVQVGDSVSLRPDDIRQIRVQRVRDDGRLTDWYAVQTRTNADDWLIIYWLSYGMRTLKLPWGLAAWLERFAVSGLSPALLRLAAREKAFRLYGGYWSRGDVQHRTVAASLRWLGFSTLVVLCSSVVFAVTGPPGATVLFLFATVVLGILCGIRLERRAAEWTLPVGPWSVRVMKSAITLTAAGEEIRLTPEDVERIAFREIPSRNGTRLPSRAVQVRPRPGSEVSLAFEDGWLPIYWGWNPFGWQSIPVELLAALNEFSGERFDEDLSERARRAGMNVGT